jgi:hypothetical protein
MRSWPALTAMGSEMLLVCTGALESLTLKVTMAIALTVVGVPLSTPVAASSVMPAGSAPAATCHV